MDFIKSITWFKFIFVMSFGFLFNSLNCLTESNGCKAPNIIYILADDLGYGDISTYNEEGKIITPNIDRIASEGIKFTDAHTSSSVCTPTRYGILTGRYNWRSSLKSGVLTGSSKALIPSSRTTVASLLKKQGYHTAFIGKWHLGWDWAMKQPGGKLGSGWNEGDFENIDYTKEVANNPNDLGFDYAYGHAGSLDMAPYVYVENGKATEFPDTMTVNQGKYSWWRKGPTAKDFIHEDVTPNFFRRAINHINVRSQKDQPFFLYLALPSPHTPILPTEEWEGKSKLNPYADFVMMVDAYIGSLERAIKVNGIEENTLLIFTSDNGCSPAAKIDELKEKEHYPSYIYRGHKADIFEGGHRVPFIAKWPEKIQKGIVSDETICTTDLMATCADLSGYSFSKDEGEDSFSMLPIFEKGKSQRESTVHHSINGSFAIRKDEWKLILCPGSGGWSFPKPGNKEVIDTLPKHQLYNLERDPGETNNLIVQYPEKVEELRSLLIRYINEGRSTPGEPVKNDSISFIWKQRDLILKQKN